MNDLPYNPDDSQDDLTGPRPPRALPRLRFTDIHRQMRSRLAPLALVQHTLEAKIGSASQEVFASGGVEVAGPFDGQPTAHSGRRALQEFSINSSNGWKSALDKFRSKKEVTRSDTSSAVMTGPNSSRTDSTRDSDDDDVAEAIASCRDWIRILWEDDIVLEMLNRRKIRLEDAPGLCVTSFLRRRRYLLIST